MNLNKNHACPYCEKPITDKFLIKEPNKFLTTKKVKTFCPYCHGQVEKSVPIKYIIFGLFCGIMIAVVQGWLRELHIISDFWLSIFGSLLTSFTLLPIIFLGADNAPYVRSKNTIQSK